MRHAEAIAVEVERMLMPGERVVRAPEAARGSWLVLTDRRLLVLTAGRRSQPPRVEAAEDLSDIKVEKRWLWSKLEQGLVIRSSDGSVRRVRLRSTKARRTRFGMAQALRRFVDDADLWKHARLTTGPGLPAGALGAPGLPPPAAAVLVAPPMSTPVASVPAIAYLRARALRCSTPAQLARLVGVDTAVVAARLTDAPRPFSHGALHGFTFTRQDAELFDETARARLFDGVAAELGEAELLLRTGTPHTEWWQTQAGDTAASLLGAFDVPVAHISTTRAPIRRWQRTVAWIGLVGAGLLTAFSFGLLFPLLLLWRRSYNHWLDGSIERPTAAITLGAITVLLPVVVMVVAVLAALVGLVAG